jgi:dipeptide/tripeptide permease
MGCSEPETLSKLAWGNLMVGLSFLFLVGGGMSIGGADGMAGPEQEIDPEGGGEEKVSVLWVGAHILLLTVGELHVQPVGLSFISRYAPEGYASIMMGAFR